MKVVTILGSPKKNGKTAEALTMLEDTLISGGNEVERISVVDYMVNGCHGCGACMAKKDEPGCVQKDGRCGPSA